MNRPHVLYRFPAGVLLVALLQLCLGVACAHTPTQEDRDKAKGHYGIGLAFVHEARRAGTVGDRAQQDFKWRKALGELLDGEKLDPDNPELQYLLGMVYFIGFREVDQAKAHLLNALKLKENIYPEADQLLGTMLVDNGQPEEALLHLERARGNLLYETPYFAEQELGWAKFKLHRYDEAAQHLNAAIALQPDLCGAYTRLADVEEARNDVSRSAAVLHDFLQHCDTELLRDACGPRLLAYGYFRVGMNELKLGNKDEAGAALTVCTTRFAAEPVARQCAESLRLLATP